MLSLASAYVSAKSSNQPSKSFNNKQSHMSVAVG